MRTPCNQKGGAPNARKKSGLPAFDGASSKKLESNPEPMRRAHGKITAESDTNVKRGEQSAKRRKRRKMGIAKTRKVMYP